MLRLSGRARFEPAGELSSVTSNTVVHSPCQHVHTIAEGRGNMTHILRIELLKWAAFMFVFPAISLAQKQQTDIEILKQSAPKIYLDCDMCDLDFIRTEITFVNYVRDRKEAQIHVLVTTQSTGGGGTEYTLTFSGQKEFEGHDDVFKYVSHATDTSDEIRKGLAGILKIGLIAYAGKTPIADRLSISLTGQTKPTSVTDKWDSWVFSLNGSGYFNGEKSERSSSIYGSFSANRITPALKIRASVSANRSTDRFSLEDQTIVSTSKSQNLNSLVVKSINNHWSVGAGLAASSSTYSNIKLLISPAPAIEYDLFPYSESTRRQLRFLYKPGFNAYRYREETIYNKTSENLWGQTLMVTLELKEKWGFVSNSFEAFHYFNDLHKNHLQSYSEVSLRLFKGLSFTLYGSFSRIHDQLSLPNEGATLEEILLRRTQLATSYSYYASIGLSYTFGSIYSNVVNPRFGGY